MWFCKRKEKEELTIHEYRSIISITLINNHTDKEYIFTSRNKFGLGWERRNYGGAILLYQKKALLSDDEEIIVMLTDFSIINIVRGSYMSTIEEERQKEIIEDQRY